MSLQRARSAAEYADWVQQAKFEVEDLKACLLYDLEEIGETGRFPAFIEPLEAGVKEVYDAMCNGTYAFGREDLPFMEVAEANADQIPFVTLLKQINDTHRKGIDTGEGD